MNQIIKELERLKMVNENLNQKLPIPVYLYQARFGRGLEAHMEAITRAYQKEHYISYKTILNTHTNLLDGFLAEMERNNRFGELWNGVVFIHFQGSEEPQEQDVRQLCEYLMQLRERVIPVFVTDQRAVGKELEEVLRNYFFLRTVEACAFEKEELLHMAEARLRGYGYRLREDAYDCMEQYMKEKTWDEVDMVETQLCGMLDQLIFDHTLQTERTDHKLVEKEEVEKIFTTQTRKQHTIGFVIG